MAFAGFVDCHSHLAPTGDDGVRSVEEGAELAREAATTGTAVLYLTPHVWDDLPMHAGRERRFREAVAELRERLCAAGRPAQGHAGRRVDGGPPVGPPELRIGFELSPAGALLDQDPHRYALEGTAVCLVETPFAGSLARFYAVAEHVAAAGLTPLVAHPERSHAITGTRGALDALLERRWPLQVTGASLTGGNGREAEEVAFRILERHEQAVVASDGHRAHRPARLDAAWAAVERRLGGEVAERAFGGAGIPGLAPGA